MLTTHRKIHVFIALILAATMATAADTAHKPVDVQSGSAGGNARTAGSGADAVVKDNASSIRKRFDDFNARWRQSNIPMPDFVAYDLDGRPVRPSDFRGKVVLMDFWYTTCGMCIKGMPGLHEIAVRYAPQGLVVIASGMPEKREDFEKFVRIHQERYPQFIWAQDRSAEKRSDGVAHAQLGIIGAPSQFLLDRTGRIVAASNTEVEILMNLPLAGIEVEEADLQKARKDQADRIERAKKKSEGSVLRPREP